MMADKPDDYSPFRKVICKVDLFTMPAIQRLQAEAGQKADPTDHFSPGDYLDQEQTRRKAAIETAREKYGQLCSSKGGALCSLHVWINDTLRQEGMLLLKKQEKLEIENLNE